MAMKVATDRVGILRFHKKNPRASNTIAEICPGHLPDYSLHVKRPAIHQ